jgi:hypothetical protein
LEESLPVEHSNSDKVDPPIGDSKEEEVTQAEDQVSENKDTSSIDTAANQPEAPEEE